MKRPLYILGIASLFLTATACNTEHAQQEQPRAAINVQTDVPLAPRYSFRIKQVLPHDTTAFTQGLEIHGGTFVESTGQNGKSSIRKVAIGTGKVLERVPLDEIFFGEGATVLGGEIYMLTWLNQTGLVYDGKTLREKRRFKYLGEGWGLCNDHSLLYKSNGSNVITVHNPSDFSLVRSINVTMDGTPIDRLNELEWIDGMIWANVWQKDIVVSIDPATGIVRKVVDLTGLLSDAERNQNTDVLNGIAWDSSSKTMYVTGKNWPHVYAIEVQ